VQMWLVWEVLFCACLIGAPDWCCVHTSEVACCPSCIAVFPLYSYVLLDMGELGRDGSRQCIVSYFFL
jgi:hypothetical protein